jgi:hypothetical protein
MFGRKKKQPERPPFRRRLEKKNRYLFIEYWKEGERPFNWFAEWEHLALEISDIRVTVSHQYVDQKFGRDQKSITLRRVDEETIPKDVPDDQKKAHLEAVSNLFNDSFTKPDSEQISIISGKFATEQHSIGFIRSGEIEESRRGTQEGYISVYSSTDVREGHLWSVSEDESQWVGTHSPGDVCINLSIAPAQIEAAIAEIRQATLANRQIKVTVNCYVLAFRSEVDRSFAEPYHSQTYWFEDEVFAPAMLGRLATTIDGDKADGPGPTTTPSATQKLPPAVQPQYSMKALVIALWAIAVAIILHALMRS